MPRGQTTKERDPQPSSHHWACKVKAKELRLVILEEQENPSPKGKQQVADEGTPGQLGTTIWNDILGSDTLELPSTSFMKKVEQAVKEADYKQLMEKVLDSLQKKGGNSAKIYTPHSKKQEISCTSWWRK